ncbi:MAG: hypothetical protein IKK33_13080 [Lachnospiraceae bacterium]|nr:hypothetical protein [Lachnospiraceae bacterium]
MKRKLIMAIIIMGILSLSSCGKQETNNDSSVSTISQTSQNNETEDTKEESEKKDNINEENKQSEYAYDFATDSKNKKIADIRNIAGTDMYEVNYNMKKACHYIMDSNGNTVLCPDDEVEDSLYVLSNDRRYIYDPGLNIAVCDAITHQNVTPDGVADGASGKLLFIKNDILVTQKGAYDLKTGKPLWKDKEIGIELQTYRNDSMCKGYETTNNVCLYNYLTGENLLEIVKKDLPESNIRDVQINDSDYFCIEIDGTIKVYDNTGKAISEFPLTENYQLFNESFPGAHFVFKSKESGSSGEKLLITDIYGNVVRDDVWLNRTSGIDMNFLDIGDVFIVNGHTQKQNTSYGGVLDENMEWVISQSDMQYTSVERYYDDIYRLTTKDNKKCIYNAKTDAMMQVDEKAYIRIRYSNDNNQLFSIGNEMYNINNLEKISIDYKEGCTYEQISVSSFAEYYKNEAKPVTVYDASGNMLKVIELKEGYKYVSGSGNSVVIYSKENGFELFIERKQLTIKIYPIHINNNLTMNIHTSKNTKTIIRA